MPKVKRKMVKVEPYRKYMMCPDCDIELAFNGTSYPTSPLQYGHDCRSCKKTFKTTERSGDIFYREISN